MPNMSFSSSRYSQPQLIGAIINIVLVNGQQSTKSIGGEIIVLETIKMLIHW
jgi:hypothetical protein